MTDWFFNSDWIYKRYDRHPEIWRKWSKGETTAVLWASLLPFFTCLTFAIACGWLHLHTSGETFMAALAVWLMVPAPLIIAHALFIKLSPAIAAAQALSWLVKLALAAVAVSVIVG